MSPSFLHANRAAVRLLKALCQTEPRKTIAWESDAPALRREEIPRRFSTSSRVLIVANDWRTLNANVAALEDRGHVLAFEPAALEVRLRTATWFWDQEVFDWIGAHLHLITRPSMRHYHAAWEQKQAGLEWRENMLARQRTGRAWRKSHYGPPCRSDDVHLETQPFLQRNRGRAL